MGCGASNTIVNNFKNGVIQIKTDKTAYNPGDRISGRIYLQTNLPLPPSTLSIRLYGVEVCGYIYKSRPGSGYTSKKRKIIDSRSSLHKWESQVPPGDYEIPFTLILPDKDLPASYHQENWDFLAHVTYNMFVKLEANKKPKKADTIIRCQKMFIRKPIKRTSTSYTEERKFPVRTWCCIPRGLIAYKATFNKNLLCRDDKVELTLEVDNSQNKLKIVYFDLRLVQFTTFGRKKYYDTKVNHHVQVNIPAHSPPKTQTMTICLPSQFGKDNHTLDTRDNTFPGGREAEFGHGAMGTATQGKLIRSEYYLEVVGGMEGIRSTKTSIRCNVDLVFPDPLPGHFWLPNTWSPHVFPGVVIETMQSLKVARDVRNRRDAGNDECENLSAQTTLS